jgi:galactose oxidase
MSHLTGPAGNVLDGDTATFWHSTYTPTGSPLPHSITIDMHATMDGSGFTYLPREDGSPNGTIGRYEITTSSDGTTWSSAVATGTWNDDAREKVVVFPPVQVRFVRLTAFTEAGSRGAWSSAAELSLIGDPPSGPALPRSGWTATASDAATSHPPGNVLDGNAATMWHTAFSPNPTPLPHSLTLDLRTSRVVTGLTYLPRQDASLDRTIGRYSVTVGPRWDHVGGAGDDRNLGRRQDNEDGHVPGLVGPIRQADGLERGREPGRLDLRGRGRRPRSTSAGSSP